MQEGREGGVRAGAMRGLHDALSLALGRPSPGIVYGVVTSLLLGALAASAPVRWLDAPLLDLVARQWPAEADRTAAIAIVDLGSWTPVASEEQGPAEREAIVRLRGEQRLRMATLVDALASRTDLVVALDVVLEDTTTDEADARLAEALASADHVGFGASRLPGVWGRAWTPVAPPFEGLADRRALLDVRADLDGVVRYYGVSGAVDDSLAVAMVRRASPGTAIPARPFRVGRESTAGAGEEGWIHLAAADVAAHPEILPRHAFVLVGLWGEEGRRLDGHGIVTASGTETVPGIALHAMALERLRAGSTRSRAGTLSHAAAAAMVVGVYLLALWIAARVRPRQPGPGRGLALAVAALALPFGPSVAVCAAALGLGDLSPLVLMLAPAATLAVSRAGSSAVRRLRFAWSIAPRLTQASDALRHPLRLGFVASDPAARVPALLDAYEELAYHGLMLALLDADLTAKQQRGVRHHWHREHTLPTLLAGLATADREAREVLRRWAAGPSFSVGRRDVARCLAIQPGHPDDAPPETEHDDWFVALRNAIAHDVESWWLTPRTAEGVAAGLQQQLRAMLATPAIHRRAAGWRPAAVADTGAVTLERSEAGARRTLDATPWLLALPAEGSAQPEVFRYRGVSKHKHWPREQGVAVPTVTYVSYGPGARGARVEVRRRAAEIDAAVPGWLAIGGAEWIRGPRRRRSREGTS